MKIAFLEYLMLALIAMTVVVLIRVVGIILVIALLTAPAATSALISQRPGARMGISAALGAVFCFAGALDILQS
jgi:zinc transport system permease protein